MKRSKRRWWNRPNEVFFINSLLEQFLSLVVFLLEEIVDKAIYNFANNYINAGDAQFFDDN